MTPESRNAHLALSTLSRQVNDLSSEGSTWEPLLKTIQVFRRTDGDVTAFSRYGYFFPSEEDNIKFRALVSDGFRILPPSPKIIVIAGGSGSGKTTFTRMLLDRRADIFHWLRRSTTRPMRSKDISEEGMHRFMDEDEFEYNLPYLYGITNPYGYKYGFLLEDILDAMLSRRIWVTNVLLQLTELRTSWPRLHAKTIGILPLNIVSTFDDSVRLKMADTIRQRLMNRDGLISQRELNARLEKACRDIELLYSIADYIIINETASDLEKTFAEIEAASLTLHSI